MKSFAMGDSLWASKRMRPHASSAYWTPLELNPKFYSRADCGVLEDTGRVARWEDSSHWRWYSQQTTAGERPVKDTVAGRPVIKFTKASTETLHAFEERQYAAGNSTWFIVARWRTLNDEGMGLVMEPTGNELCCASFGTDLKWIGNTEVIQPSLNANTTDFFAMMGVVDNDNNLFTAYRMVAGAWASQGTAAIAGGTTANLGHSFGGRPLSGAWNEFYSDTDVAEAMFVDRVIRSEEITYSGNYIHRRYAL